MKQLLQLLLNAVVERRIFASFPEFKKADENQAIDLTKFKKNLEKDQTYRVVIDSKVDPKELREMLEKSFDAAQARLKENVFKTFDAIFAE